MRGQLNIYQRTMLQWNELHPYNAVHVVRIAGPPDLTRLHAAITATLTARGLTRLTIDSTAARFEYRGGPVDCEITTAATLAPEVERQLNLAFVPGENFSPFRFFVVPHSENFSLGLVYWHVIADAEAIILLLRELAERYITGAAVPALPPEIHPPRHDRLWRQPPTLLARKFAALPGDIRAMRRSCRPPLGNAGDLTNGFALLPLPSDALPTLIGAAKRWDATVNDVFLALLLRSCDPHGAHLQFAGRRREISLGCIVNLRRELPAAARGAFGLFLGSFTVSHRVPADASLPELVAAVRLRTLAIKRGKRSAGPPLELLLGRPLLARYPLAQRSGVYHKNYPLWGGLTNLNLNPLWPPTAALPTPDYFRAVSTGPVTPLVLSITTAGAAVNVGVSWRRNIHTAATAAAVQAQFLKSLGELA